MAEVKDNILELNKVYVALNTTINENIKYLEKGATAVEKYNKVISIKPSDYSKGIEEINTKTKQLEQSQKNLEVTEKKLQQTRLQEIKLQKQREKAFDDFDKKLQASNKQIEREQQLLEKSNSIYNKVQQKVNSLTKTYNDIAIKKELGLKISSREEGQLLSLESRLQKYQTALLNVDANIGKHQRNVGNYAGSFNGLSNSINQITRELPAFTFSAQTGFLALSNNIPILTDEIGRLVDKNKELAKTGQPVKSVFSQILGSLFSLQTAMGVGILLFTLYGKEIGEFITNIFKSSKALDVLKESQKAINEISLEGRKNAQQEIISLKSLLEIAKDTSLSYKERMIAVEELQRTYPAYFGNLEKNKILAGDVADAEIQLTNAILSRAKSQAATSKIVENQSKIIDLEEKKLEITKKQIVAEEQLELAKKQSTSGGSAIGGTSNLAKESMVYKLKSDILKTDKEINEIQEINNRLTTYAIGEEKKSILLKDKEEKQVTVKKEKIALNFKEIESQYLLKKAILESQKAEYQNAMNNENLSLNDRFKARQNFTKKSIELIDLETKYSVASLDNEMKNNIEKSKLALKNKEISQKQHLENLKDILNKYQNETNILSIKELENKKQIIDSETKHFFDNEKTKKKFKDETYNEVISNRIKLLDKEIEKDNISFSTKQALFDSRKKLILEELNLQYIQEKINASSEEENRFIELRYNNLRKEINKTKTPLEELSELAKETAKSMVDSFANNVGFKTSFDILNGNIKGFGENWLITTDAILTASTEMFNFLNSMSQENFDAEYERENRRKENALMFAGDSAEAKAEIEKESERRMREIKKREAQAQKKQAIFQATIDMVKGIMGAIAAQPLTLGMPQAAIIGALGLVNIARINSQQIPEYWKGTDNAPEGIAWTNERGREIIKDAKGKIKDFGTDKGKTLKYLNKGDKVLKHSDTMRELDNILMQNNISSPKENINIDLLPLEQRIDKLTNIISNKSEITIVKDMQGERYFQRVNGQRQELKNTILNLKSRNV
jgi:hypothetical protein